MTEFANKVLLVQPSAIRNMQGPKPDSEIDREIYSILKKPMSSYEKWRLYEQAVRRFANSNAEEPVRILLEDVRPTVKQEPLEEPSCGETLSEKDIVRLLPAIYQKKAASILEYITKSPRISWDSHGAVTIDKATIKGSNITDLLVDCLRKSSFTPQGVQQFVNLLSELAVPRYLIGNTDRRAQIEQAITQEESFEQPSPKAKSPRKSLRAVRPSAKAQSAQWIPYK
jgi:hypothetical protein